MKWKKESLWKFYAWLLLPFAVLYVLGAIIAVLAQEYVTVDQLFLWLVAFSIMGLAVVGVFRFAYKKPPKRRYFWRLAFILVIAMQVIYPAIQWAISGITIPGMAVIRLAAFMILLVPMYVALYFYAWPRTPIPVEPASATNLNRN